MLIFTIKKADTTREATRKVITDFFKEKLSFKDENIIFVDRNEFISDIKNGVFKTQFSAETKEAMKKFARPVFEDAQFGLANQVLNIAICENQGRKYKASNYFKMASNFELTIELSDLFTLANAREYFDGLR